VSEPESADEMEAPEHHAHAHHGTGIRWVDISLGLAALFTSIVSLGLALMHGHEMQKLVAANSLPYLGVDMSDMESDRKTHAVVLSVSNRGVGPARIDEVTITVDGKPVGTFAELGERCCGRQKSAQVDDGGPLVTNPDDPDVKTSTLRDRMIRPGETVEAIDWPEVQGNHAIVDRLRKGLHSGRIVPKVCYCSVFEECWEMAYLARRPKPVESCPVAPTPYRQ